MEFLHDACRSCAPRPENRPLNRAVVSGAERMETATERENELCKR